MSPLIELLQRTLLGDAPGRVDLDKNDDFTLQVASATFDGSGASGSFLACLSIYSQSGALLSRTFPSQVFASGDSGEVTYGPFLEQASGGSTDLSSVEIKAATLYSIPAETQTTINAFSNGLEKWRNFWTNDTSVFSTRPNNAIGDTELNLLKAGLYLVYAFVEWDASAFSHQTFIEDSGLGSGSQIVEIDAPPGDQTGFSNVFTSWLAIWVTGSGRRIGIQLVNGDAVAHNIVQAFLTCVYYPTDTAGFARRYGTG